jgi:hypothetical protein
VLFKIKLTNQAKTKTIFYFNLIDSLEPKSLKAKINKKYLKIFGVIFQKLLIFGKLIN